MKKTKVIIAGGGFAGLSAAMYLDKTLARRDDVEVTLISRENFILFTPMLHEVAAGDLYPGDIVNPLRRILRHVKSVEAEAQAINLSERRVRCVGGVAQLALEFEFDHVLLTLGTATNFVIHPGDFLLPELGQELGDYAERKLRERKVDVIKGVRVSNYDGTVITLTDGNKISASTLIWTAGVKPSPVIAPLSCEKERGRLL